MTWQQAVDEALQYFERTGRRVYVRGYRGCPTCRWRYGVFLEDRPPLVSRGWA